MKTNQKQAERSTEVVRAYQSVFNSEDGQLVLYDIMDQGHIFQPTNSTNSHECTIAEGRRAMAQMILHMTEKKVKDIKNLHTSYKDEEAAYHASLT